MKERLCLTRGLWMVLKLVLLPSVVDRQIFVELQR